MKKILLIEDDQLVGNIYRNKFSVENYLVETAEDGESGFDLLTSFQPDVVILDLMLPRMSGLDLLKKIRATEEFKNLPIIVFSNTYLSNMVQEAWKAGATKCLSKANCTPKQVIEVLRSIFVQNPATATVTSGVSATSASVIDAPPAVNDSEVEAAAQAELRQNFFKSLSEVLGTCRITLQAAAKLTDEAGRVKELQNLYRHIHALTGNAGAAGVLQIAQMSDATEALLKELYEKPKNITVSTLRTVALAIDFLAILFEQCKAGKLPPTAAQSKSSILVVDDEAISRRAVTYALEKARLSAVSVENPLTALEMLGANNYDLVFLDVDMPGMNGFELCTRLRGMARNKNTPVIFVTSLTGFESRANSTMSGGNDLIAKPFLFMELAVKALVYVLRARLNSPART